MRYRVPDGAGLALLLNRLHDRYRPLALGSTGSRNPRPDADPSSTTRRARHLTAAEIDTLVERYEALRSPRIVSSELDIDRATARAHLVKQGIVLEPKASMTAAHVARAVELYEVGKPSTAIGRALGFDNKTVLKELRAAGVAIRPRAGFCAAASSKSLVSARSCGGVKLMRSP